jgi:hypothetical protein
MIIALTNARQKAFFMAILIQYQYEPRGFLCHQLK